MQSHCIICLEDHPLDVFRFLPCGHGFCLESLQEYTRGSKTPCPICRTPFRLSDAHTIYLLAESTPSPAGPSSTPISTSPEHKEVRLSKAALRQARHVAKEIRRVDTSTVRSQDVLTMGAEVEKVASGLGRESSHVETLLSAVADFWKRVAPIVATAAEQEQELRALKQERTAREAENRRLRGEAERATQLANEAINTTDRARHEVANWAAENEKLKKRLTQKDTQCSQGIALKDEEIKGLKDKLVAHKKKELQQIEKIKNLKDELNEQNEVLVDLRAATDRPASEPGWKYSPARSQCSTHSTQESIYVAPYSDENTELQSDDLGYVGITSLRPLLVRKSCTPRAHLRPVPQRPRFPSDWNLHGQQKDRKRKREDSETSFPIKLDTKGQVKGIVQLGSRQRHSFK